MARSFFLWSCPLPDSYSPLQIAQADTAPAAATPAPTPSPAPSPTPSPAPTPKQAATPRPVQTIAQDVVELPVIRNLPFKGLILVSVELVLLVALYLLLRRVVRRLVRNTTHVVARRDEEAGQPGRAVRIRTLSGLLEGIALWTLAFIFFVSGLSALNINITAVVGTASVLGLAFGFGAQKLAKDVITGFFILLEDQYVVGDYVTINSVTGTIEELGMRITRLRDDEGKLYILSNGDIAQVCNQSRGPVAGNFEIAVAASADTEQATNVLNEAMERASTELGLPQNAKVDGVSSADALKTAFRISFHAKPGERPAADALRLRERARAALISAGIPLG